MKLFISFMVFAVFYFIFDWIVNKADLKNKLFNGQYKKSNYFKALAVILVIVTAISFEYFRGFLKDTYPNYPYISMLVAALLSTIYINFVPAVFIKKKA